MGLDNLSRLRLARTPTPVFHLELPNMDPELSLFVKRDDLTGFALSGNKVRKLELLVADALASGADTLITCGGTQSNHCRATAVVARQQGLNISLLLRGERGAPSKGNELLDRVLGANITYCSAHQYRHDRDEIMQQMATEVSARGKKAYVIPEGGSNALGSVGFAFAGQELLSEHGQFDHVFMAVGSGGTLAGLVMGPDIGQLHGIAVCDDAAFFEKRVVDIVAEAVKFGVPPPEPPGGRWRVVDRYKGEAYGVANQAVWKIIGDVARSTGLLLDPVYTGKAMHGMLCEIERLRLKGRVLFWHTGGAFGLFGRGQEVDQELV